MQRNYSKREPNEYNLWRKIFQWLTVNVAYGFYYKVACGLKVYGRQNVPKDRFLIIASNHISAIDPFLIIYAVKRATAYMAKQELFEKPVPRFFLDWLGAFAVNREKLQVSTIKTALAIKKTDWCLGLFPQGTREVDGNMDNVMSGFAGLARTLKCEILPVGITGVAKDERKPFHGNMKINIGKPIPYSENTDEMVKIWIEKIEELTR